MINKWRFEIADPTQPLSLPKKHLIYYINPIVPAKRRPYLKQGAENRDEGFDLMGIINATRAILPTDYNFPAD